MYKTYERYSTSIGLRLTRGFLFPLLKIILITFFLHLLVSSFVVTSYRVDSGSMLPTLQERDRILTAPLVYGAKLPLFKKRFPGFDRPKRGDIVVVIDPAYPHRSLLIRTVETVFNFISLQKGSIIRDAGGGKAPRFIVKRIVGLPGDTVKISAYSAHIKPPGSAVFYEEHELIEPAYTIRRLPLPEGWKDEYPLSGNLSGITLGKTEYFLLGDNRSASSDSRSWGPIEEDRILGKAIVRYWPLRSSGRI